MPWWSVLRDGLRRPRAGSSAAAEQPSAQRHSTPEPQPAESLPQPPEQAWRDLPALQRTLAAPIEPAAPLDAFTGSLTAHQNPSFLAPLGHRVDPDAGGLVDGLADLTPGHPIFYSAGSELPVPTAGKPMVQRKLAVQRTVAEWPARGASWLGAVDDPYVVDTVRMEHPSVDVTGKGGVVAGHGTSDAPLALTAPTPSPTVSRPTVQRHAVASAGVPEEPVEAGAAGMEAIEGLTISRLAESTALPADLPTLGRTGEDAPAGPAPLQSSARASAAAEVPGHAHPESGAEPLEVARAAELGALPIAPVQRQVAQAADLRVRRSWPVVPEQAVRAAAFPALPVVELTVARSVESGAPSMPLAGAEGARDLGPASETADSPASGGAEPTDAPLSGFAAAISALHGGDAADAPVQHAADPGAENMDGPSTQPPSGAGIQGSGGTTARMPVQRLAVGPGEFVQAGQPGFVQAELGPHDSGSGGSVVPAFGGSAADVPTLGTTQQAVDLTGEATSQDRSEGPEALGSADPTIARATGGQPTESAVASPGVVEGRLVDDELPELPVVAPGRPAAARGSVAMPVVGSAPVQRSVADPSDWTPVRTTGLLASRTPTLQLQQLSSATPAPPPVQRVTFLADAASAGAVAQRLPAPTPGAATIGPSGQRGSTSVGSATDVAGSAPASRTDRFSAFESRASSDPVQWEPVPLEQAADDESGASAAYGIDEPPVVQRAVELPAGPSAGSRGNTNEHPDSWASADHEVVALDRYAAVRSVEPPASPRRPATVMPPMPIVQRHTAAAESAPTPTHRSSSAGISFASIFAAASEAAETGYTTVQLQADDSSHDVDASEADSTPTAPAPGVSVQREGEAPPPSTPAPAGAPAGGAPGAGGAPAGADLDEMARRLFEPLSARLRAEFWLDRERAGLMTDARP
jgi:hypothetical protein